MVLNTGLHISLDVLPSWADPGSCSRSSYVMFFFFNRRHKYRKIRCFKSSGRQIECFESQQECFESHIGCFPSFPFSLCPPWAKLHFTGTGVNLIDIWPKTQLLIKMSINPSVYSCLWVYLELSWELFLWMWKKNSYNEEYCKSWIPSATNK